MTSSEVAPRCSLQVSLTRGAFTLPPCSTDLPIFIASLVAAVKLLKKTVALERAMIEDVGLAGWSVDKAHTETATVEADAESG